MSNTFLLPTVHISIFELQNSGCTVTTAPLTNMFKEHSVCFLYKLKK